MVKKGLLFLGGGIVLVEQDQGEVMDFHVVTLSIMS